MRIPSEIWMFLPILRAIEFWTNFGVGNLWTISSRKEGGKMGVARARVGNLWRGAQMKVKRVTKRRMPTHPPKAVGPPYPNRAKYRSLRNFARKKFETMIAMKLTTNASVAALPTPAAPLLQLNPL